MLKLVDHLFPKAFASWSGIVLSQTEIDLTSLSNKDIIINDDIIDYIQFNSKTNDYITIDNLMLWFIKNMQSNLAILKF